mmetsp:Transcript_138172/g.441519  ORF Transcript_138172/g.441519 Transcript_138172/m.441519 type:complete len:227 (+) Transcript_138172:785-1465(+)
MLECLGHVLARDAHLVQLLLHVGLLHVGAVLVPLTHPPDVADLFLNAPQGLLCASVLILLRPFQVLEVGLRGLDELHDVSTGLGCRVQLLLVGVSHLLHHHGVVRRYCVGGRLEVGLQILQGSVHGVFEYRHRRVRLAQQRVHLPLHRGDLVHRGLRALDVLDLGLQLPDSRIRDPQVRNHLRQTRLLAPQLVLRTVEPSLQRHQLYLEVSLGAVHDARHLRQTSV